MSTQLGVAGDAPAGTPSQLHIYLTLLVASLVAALPVGAALRRYRLADLLSVAAAMTAFQEFWYVAMMATSPDPTADTRGGVFFVLSATPRSR